MSSQSLGALRVPSSREAHRNLRLSLTRGNPFPQGDRPANAGLGAPWLGSPEFPRPLGVPAEVPALELVR